MTVTSLITAAEAFPALERLVAGAEHEVLLSFRIFDPTTRLRDPDLREKGLQDWADLVTAVAARGVRVRLVLADFDAVLTPELHRLAWRSASRFADRAAGDMQVLCAAHGQRAGRFWHILMRSLIKRGLTALAREDIVRLTPPQRDALRAGPVLRPVTIHQKIAIADGRHSIIGGIDVNERRFDTPGHERPADQTWHDVSVEIHNRDFGGALKGHFADTWNDALAAGAVSLANRAEPFEPGPRPQAPPDLRLIRTRSAPQDGAFRLGPRYDVTDHVTCIADLIGNSRSHVYIETQFLRHTETVKALVAAARREADLQLVLLLPAAPDRILFDGHHGWDARHAHGLQHRHLRALQAAFGDRAALIAPGQPWRDDERAASHEGAGPVYIHSKVLVTDGEAALVGSANLNGRSMYWDTEASVLIRRPDDVRRLHARIAEKWLGDAAQGDTTRAATWARVARENADTPPEARTGFVLPYPVERSERFSRRLPFLPEHMF